MASLDRATEGIELIRESIKSGVILGDTVSTPNAGEKQFWRLALPQLDLDSESKDL